MSKIEERLTFGPARIGTTEVRKERSLQWVETGSIFAAGLILFLIGQHGRELIQLECRSALFVKEMFQNGVGWFPTVYGRPYPDYPVTHPVFIYAIAALFGKLTVQVAVLPTAFSAALSLALTYRLGLIASRSLALWAVLFELGTYGFFSTARTVSVDHLTTAATAGCLLAVCSWLLNGKTQQLMLVVLLCVVGFACRGPIGFLIPASVVVTCCLAEKRYRAILLLFVVLAGLFAGCIVGLGAVAQQAGGPGFVREVWFMQVSSRITGSHAKPFYYYLVHTFTTYAISFPLAFACLLGMRKVLFASWVGRGASLKSSRLFTLLSACFLVLLIGLHVPSAKMARYLLPLAPIASLIGAFLVAGEARALVRTRAWLIKALGLLPVTALGTGVLLLITWRYLPFDGSPSWGFLLSALSAVTFARLKLVPRIAELETRELALAALGVIVLSVSHVSVVEPIKESLEGARPFVARVEALRADTEPLVFYSIGPDQEDIRFVANTALLVKPQFVHSAEDLLRLPEHAWVITSDSDFATLPRMTRERARLHFRGRLGHRRCVVFQMTGADRGRREVGWH